MTRTLLSAASAAALLLAPAAAQGMDAPEAPSREQVVTNTLGMPAIDALGAPDARQGDYVDVDGGRIFYERSGRGPALVLLHGYPLSGALFSRVREQLEDQFTVVTVDHRGYGLSEADGIPDSVETYASDALAVMDAIGIDRAIVGGMSMGGPIVFSMYEMAPERFGGMVLIDTTAAAAKPPEAGLWRGVAEVIEANGMEPIYPALLPDMLSGRTRLDDPAVGDYLTEIMKGATPEAGRGGAIALAERPDRTDMLGTITIPTLVIVGEEDALYSMDVSHGMVEKLPDADLAIVPRASHAAVFEEGGYAAAAIQDWAGRTYPNIARPQQAGD